MCRAKEAKLEHFVKDAFTWSKQPLCTAKAVNLLTKILLKRMHSPFDSKCPWITRFLPWVTVVWGPVLPSKVLDVAQEMPTVKTLCSVASAVPHG